MNVQQRLDNFEIHLKSERVRQATLKTYIPIIKKFLPSIEHDDIDESDARAYLANLYDLKDNTVYKIYYALRSFYKSQNIPFNMDPPPMSDHPYRPTIGLDEMPKLITTIKERGDPVERGILAQSSVYGIRRIEIMNVSKNDINHDDRTITIRAAKGGRERVHLIPDEIYNCIMEFDFVHKSDQTYANIFWSMVKKAGLELTKGYGFHSIRRALYTGLTGKVDFYLRHEFMRWRTREINLDLIYDQTPPAQIDKIVFENHPFLKLWGV